ncbi:MAG TPA: sulfite exporter TauE/SafE family protein [Gemmatimonadaceae bacterium]|nr:sulfite exporter TauE/SafE family protein [Gemmatimonadaceae bacterium]
MTLVLGVLAASLLGSVHCAAMCGAFTCLYAPPGRAARLASQLAYNVGRLVSYTLLGVVAGALGARMNVLGERAGVTHAAEVLAGSLMIAWAAGVFAASLGVRIPVTLAPEWAKRLLGNVLVAARERSERTRALLMGLVTTLLPCGWLYTFVVVAGGTGSAWRGAAVMFAFWLGTVPVLLTVGVAAPRLLRPFARRLPLVSAALVLTLGVLSVAGKLRAPGARAHDGMPMGPSHVVP